MMLGQVIGEVWATRKHRRLTERKLLLVAAMRRSPDGALEPTGEVVVAQDTISSGPGHLVVVTWGSGARRVYKEPDNRSILADACVVRIVDEYSFGQEIIDVQGNK